MLVPSYFGSLAQSQNLQALIDASALELDAFSIWRNWLDLTPAQVSLKFDTAIGRMKIPAMASVVDSSAPAPLRTRPTLELYTGRIPSIKEKFRLEDDDMRELELLRSLPVIGGGISPLLQFLINDLRDASVAGDKRIDFMLLNAMSTLTIDMTVTNNPDGVDLGTIDLLPQSYQKQGVPTVWSDIASTPITDIQNYIESASDLHGHEFGQIVMSSDLWKLFRKTTEVIQRITTFLGISVQSPNVTVTPEVVNKYFDSEGWPPLTVLRHSSRFEKDGTDNFVKGFNVNNVMFAPAGKIGVLKNAISMEQLRPVPYKTYANYGPTLVSKCMDNDPLVEFTFMEMLAFPVVNVDAIWILKTDTAFAGPFL